MFVERAVVLGITGWLMFVGRVVVLGNNRLADVCWTGSSAGDNRLADVCWTGSSAGDNRLADVCWTGSSARDQYARLQGNSSIPRATSRRQLNSSVTQQDSVDPGGTGFRWQTENSTA